MEIPSDMDAGGYSQSSYSHLQSIVGKGLMQRTFHVLRQNGGRC